MYRSVLFVYIWRYIGFIANIRSAAFYSYAHKELVICEKFSLYTFVLRELISAYFADELELCPSEEIFLLRLLKSGPVEKTVSSELVEYAKEALRLHQSVIMDLLKNLKENINVLWSRNECLKLALNSKLSPEGTSFYHYMAE
jgi:hypothetical protein